jgi:hypothetical protein
MSQVIAAKLLIALTIGVTVAGCGHRPPLEDEPGWNCQTQGNLVCGQAKEDS